MAVVSKPDTADSGLEAGRRVLELEAEGIRGLADTIGGTFLETLDILAAVEGRVVVSGMGKSGHVGRKIAATLASTGTPALFVHPAEASHGDLGMITSQDAILALSNSGETPELGNLVEYARRFAIPIIAITRGAKSALAEAANVALIIPAATEACPMGLAPTTTTTMMLALGDAVAVALLERKGFTSEDFQILHPGGKLGRRLLRVRDLMHAGDEIPLTDPAAAMSDAILVMTSKRFGCVGVVDGAGRLVGIITDGDLRRHMRPDLLQRTAGEVATGDPKSIRPGALASEALGFMSGRAITSLFVVEDDRPVGILHMHDCLRAGVA